MRLGTLRWLILGLLFLSTVINYVDRQALSVLLPTLRTELGLTSAAMGAILAPPVVALLASYFGWRAAFLTTGLLGFAWLAAWLLVYHSPERHPWLSAEDRAKVVEELGPVKLKPPVFGAPFLRIIGTRQLWGLLVTRMVATPVWWFYVFWLPDYFSQSRGFSLK